MNDYRARAIPQKHGWELRVHDKDELIGVGQIPHQDEEEAYAMVLGFIRAHLNGPLSPPFSVSVNWGREPIPVEAVGA